MKIRNLGFAGLLLIAQAGLAGAAQQADPSDSHAHHHQAASGPPASVLGAQDAKFSMALVTSSPANGAVLSHSPQTISLTFPNKITIRQIALTTAVGQRVPIAAALPTEAVESFSSPVVPLDPGSYKLLWRGSADAGELGGSLAFSVR